MTKIEVQVGTPQQRKAIEQELSVIVACLADVSPPVELHTVVVPIDFDATVNSLAATRIFRSVRPSGGWVFTAIAKVVTGPSGNHLIVSPALFTHSFDQQSRCFTYFHEIRHFVNAHQLLSDPEPTTAANIYLHNARTFLDEYVAARQAYASAIRMFGAISAHWESQLKTEFGHFVSVITDPTHRLAINSAVASLDSRIDVFKYFRELQPVFDAVALSLVHCYALHDALPADHPFPLLLSTSHFMNESTARLFDGIRAKYSQGDLDTSSLIPLVERFLFNFGVSFRDTQQGLVCTTHTI